MKAIFYAYSMHRKCIKANIAEKEPTQYPNIRHREKCATWRSYIWYLLWQSFGISGN
ncbi:MAG: hypothetical protein K0R66_1161 [Gammaproteobacteria bacterium]|jgi:hypothetical protein|nr:hypothetical protein [Gammaproteobacteria bacterium]